MDREAPRLTFFVELESQALDEEGQAGRLAIHGPSRRQDSGQLQRRIRAGPTRPSLPSAWAYTSSRPRRRPKRSRPAAPVTASKSMRGSGTDVPKPFAEVRVTPAGRSKLTVAVFM